tara:strand:- start:1115 stop:1429 length:315 start_codon:yes stop_codon:yes gene_type:complete
MKLNKEDMKNFKDYIWSFYGKDKGIYKDFFDNNLTMEEVERAIEIRLSEIKLKFDGDTIDREIVRDIMLKLREPTTETDISNAVVKSINLEIFSDKSIYKCGTK